MLNVIIRELFSLFFMYEFSDIHRPDTPNNISLKGCYNNFNILLCFF